MVRAQLCVCVAVLVCLGGCATTTGTLAALGGRWPLTESSIESKQYIDELPSEARFVVEARLESPPRAICERRLHEPAARITRDQYGPGPGARIFYGFMGLSELAIAALFTFLPRDGEPCIGCDIGAVYFGLDGTASLLMAFLLPDYHYRDVFDRPAHDMVDPLCPADVAFEAAGKAFPVQPDGHMLPEHARSLMSAVVETGSAVALRYGDDLRWTAVPPETRCEWAVQLGSALAPALCPRAPIPIGGIGP